MRRPLALSLLLASLAGPPLVAQGGVGGIGPAAHPFKVTKATFATLTCADGGTYDGTIVALTEATSTSDCTTAGSGTSTAYCACQDGSWVDAAAQGGSGDVTAVGDCASGDCFQAETARHVLAAPAAGGQASFRALVEADISDLAHTADTDTTCLDAGVDCLFAASASEGGAATTATALAANGSNCSSGNAPLGVDASGAVEGCFDVATEAELTTHTANASAHHTATVDTGPSPDCSGTLTYQDGEGNCDAYTLGGNTTSLATTSGTLTSGDCVEFDASGNLVASGAGCGGGGGGTATGIDYDGDATEEVSADGATIAFDPDDDGTAESSIGSDGDIQAGASTNGPALLAEASSLTNPTVVPYRSQDNSGIGCTGNPSTRDCALIAAGSTVAKWGNNGVTRSFEVTSGSGTVFGVYTTSGIMALTPLASAPATCAIGDFYVDTSGAACACSATNTWSNMHATGSCT